MSPKRKRLFLCACVLLLAVFSNLSQAESISSAANHPLQEGAQKRKHYTLVTLSITPGQSLVSTNTSLQLTASGTGSDGLYHTVTPHVRWTSSAPSVATVDSQGVVTAIAPGTAVITATRGIASSSQVTVTTAGTPVPVNLFSITTHSRTNWPSVTTSAFRLWDTNTDWGTMNTADGVYDFSNLDNWISSAQANNADLIYTFGQTPAWASSNPQLVCGTTNVPLGSCAPPNDLNADGTGSDKHWKDFVTAIAMHAAGQIKYWEIWNEPTVPGYWQGNNSQMIRMAQDAYAIIKSIDSSAMITTPTPSTGINGVASWMGPYLALGGGQYADIISFHGYSWKSTPGDWPVPEDIVPLVENLKAVLVTYGQTGKPLWCTEGSWGDTSGNGFTDPDLHAAFLARHYLLQESEGVARYYWFAWDNSIDGLWSYDTGVMTPAGTAYQQVQNWISGATPTGPCAQNGTTWTCEYSRSASLQLETIWDTSQTCSNGNCTTANVVVDSRYVSYLDLAGQSHIIKNNTVPVGAKPLLLQNQ